MATVDKKLADEIAAKDGWYHKDDPRVFRIVEYTTAWGNVAYGLEYRREVGRYAASEYVINPRVYWTAKNA